MSAVPAKRSRSARTRRFSSVLCAVGLIVTAGAASATAAPKTPDSIVVPQGSGTVPLESGQRLGLTNPNKTMRVAFVLRARNLKALETRVQNGWSGHYLSTAQFADAYGQTRSVVSGIKAYLHRYGIHTHVYADRLDISTTGTVADYNKALSIGLHDYRVHEVAADGSRRTHTAIVHGSVANPHMPAAAHGSAILAILGLTNYAPFASTAVKAKGHRVTAGKAPADGLPRGSLAPANFASRYHLTGLTKHGAAGQGRTVGIITLASFHRTVPLAFWNKYLGLHESLKRLHTVNIDGGAGAPSAKAGSDETDLDVEQSGALAPKADVRVYVAPNTDPGFADAFFKAGSQNIADTVSTSWGESETFVEASVASGMETSAYEASFDEAFLELAAQGQSAFAAAGDSGAYDALNDAGTTNLAIDTPANSPYVTSSGGTTLGGAQTYAVDDAANKPTGVTNTAVIPKEIAWSTDYLWPLYSALGFASEEAAVLPVLGGDGGGYSSDEPRPSYQKGVSAYEATPYLTPTTPKEIAPGLTEPTDLQFTPTPPTGSGVQRYGRAEPDVATDADPQTGYAVYDPEFFEGSFAQYGGTSFVAPQLNGSTAVIDSALGRRVGFWNPQIYSFARGSASPFTTINDTGLYSGINYLYQTDAAKKKTALAGSFSNNNLYYTGNPGAYWNPAVGLGTPNLTRLAARFSHR